MHPHGRPLGRYDRTEQKATFQLWDEYPSPRIGAASAAAAPLGTDVGGETYLTPTHVMFSPQPWRPHAPSLLAFATILTIARKRQNLKEASTGVAGTTQQMADIIKEMFGQTGRG